MLLVGSISEFAAAASILSLLLLENDSGCSIDIVSFVSLRARALLNIDMLLKLLGCHVLILLLGFL